MAEQTGSNSGAQGAGAGSGTADSAQGAGAAVAARAGADNTAKRAETSAIAERFLAKFGTYERALEVMAGEHFDYREAARKDAETIAALQRNQTPKDAVVLTGDDVKAWEKVKATGVPLKDMAATLDRAKTLEAEKARADRASKHTDVAKAAKLDPVVLSPLVEQFGFDVDTRIVKVQKRDGSGLEDQPQAIIRKAGDDKAPWEPLVEFIGKADSTLYPFRDALKAKGTSDGGNGSNGTGTTSGTRTGSQGETLHTFADDFAAGGGDGGNAGGGDIIAKRIKTQNDAAGKRSNPLLSPSTSTAGTGKTT
jgi:hypothetical protein